MELIDLKAFVAVVEEGTTTRAAKVLGMTQPGVSKHIARLEENFGCRLFERIGRRLELNDHGKMVLAQAKKIFHEMDSLNSLRSGWVCPLGNLKIGLTDSSTLIVTPPSLVKFRDAYPGIHVEFDVESSAVVEERVLSGKYDIGFVTSGNKSNPALDERGLHEDNIDALVCNNHELSFKKKVSLKDLAKHTLIMSPQRRRTRQIIDDVFNSHGLYPQNVIDVYIHSAALRLAESGLGVALLPRAFIRSEAAAHRCAHLEIEGNPIKRKINVIKKKNAGLSHAADHFYKLVAEQRTDSASSVNHNGHSNGSPPHPWSR